MSPDEQSRVMWSRLLDLLKQAFATSDGGREPELRAPDGHMRVAPPNLVTRPAISQTGSVKPRIGVLDRDALTKQLVEATNSSASTGADTFSPVTKFGWPIWKGSPARRPGGKQLREARCRMRSPGISPSPR